MFVTDLLSYAGELCLILGCGGFFLSLWGPIPSIPFVFLVTLLTEVACRLCQRFGWIRFLPLLSFGVLIPKVSSIPGFLLVALGAILLFMRLIKNRFSSSDDLIADQLKPGLITAVCLFLLALMASRFEDYATVLIPWLTAWLLLSVLTLRLLRCPPELQKDPRFVALNVGLLLLILSVCLFLSGKLFLTSLGTVAAFLFRHVIAPVLYAAILVVMFLPSVFAWLFLALLTLLRGETPASIELSTGLGSELSDLLSAEEATGSAFLKALLPILGAVLFLLIAVRLFRYFITDTERSDSRTSQVKRESIGITKTSPPIFDLGSITDPTLSLRHSYRRFLRRCREKNIPVDGSFASDRIAEAATRDMDPESVVLLRTLWLPVRYGERTASPEESRKAKRALRDLGKNR